MHTFGLRVSPGGPQHTGTVTRATDIVASLP